MPLEYHAMAEPPAQASGETSAAAAPLHARLRVVLVETQHPGNIGAAARAMKTMGLHELALVAPRRFPHPEATAMATGADDLLERAQIYPDLASAVADCGRVVATTARPRRLMAPVSTPREWCARAAAGDYDGRIALVFGRERTGLTNEEIERAQELIVIPTAETYASLNLGQAVQVLAYELWQAAGDAQQHISGHDLVDGVPRGAPHLPVSQDELERFYEHLERVLFATRFIDPDNPRYIMRRLRRLFGRAAPDANETNILRGVLAAVEAHLRRP